MKTLFAALALTVAAPTLAHALPPCRVSPRTICTIDGPADQRRVDAMPLALRPPLPSIQRPAPPFRAFTPYRKYYPSEP